MNMYCCVSSTCVCARNKRQSRWPLFPSKNFPYPFYIHDQIHDAFHYIVKDSSENVWRHIIVKCAEYEWKKLHSEIASANPNCSSTIISIIIIIDNIIIFNVIIKSLNHISQHTIFVNSNPLYISTIYILYYNMYTEPFYL